MKTLFMILPLVLVLCFAYGCEKEDDDVAEIDLETDIAAIEKINEEWDAASNAGDIDKLVSFFVDDAVRIPAGEPAIIGKEAIREWFHQLFDQYTVEQKNVVEDIRVSENLAFFRGTWGATNTPKDGGEPLKLNGSFIAIIERQPDGSWKTIVNSWSNEQLIKPWADN